MVLNKLVRYQSDTRGLEDFLCDSRNARHGNTMPHNWRIFFMVPGRSTEKTTKSVLKAFRQKYLCIMFPPLCVSQTDQVKGHRGRRSGAYPLGTVSNLDL